MPNDGINFIPDNQPITNPATEAPPSDGIHFVPHGEGAVSPPTTPENDGINFIPDDQVAASHYKYGTLPQQAIAGAEGFAKGLAGPLATGAEKLLGVPGEDIIGREEANPGTHYTTEIAGLLAPAIATAGTSALARAGLAAPEAINAVRTLGEFTQAGLLGKIGKGAAGLAEATGIGGNTLKLAGQFGTENALLAIGNELSKQIQGNPDNIQTAALNVGLSGIIGGVAGGGLGAVSDLWKGKFAPEAEGFVKDFRGRLADHANGNIPAADAVTSELENQYGATTDAVNDLRGNEGLKAQDIQKLMPEKISPQMIEQVNNLLSSIDGAVAKAKAEPGIYQGTRTQALLDYGDRLAGALADKSSTPSDIFTAMDDFKKGIGPLKDWNALHPSVEKPSAGLIGNVYQTVKNGLEDSSVWGDAAKRQQAINKVFTDYIPANKDFEKTFTDKIGNEARISPVKINTLVNQIGKPNAEIKLDKLGNYLDATDKLYTELDKIHSNLGIENPYQRPSLTATRAILQDITPGMKAADFVHGHAINMASEGAGDVAGAAIGHATGIPGGGILGGYFGHYALKPLMKTIMPTLIKPLMKLGTSALGMRGAIDALGAVVKGDALAETAAKALFTSGRQILPEALVASNEDTKKLDDQIKEYGENPVAMQNIGGSMGHYLPDHATAVAKTAATAVNYLNSQRPKTSKPGPLDAEIEPGIAQKKSFQRTLQIAEQPLTIFQHIKDGTIQSKDVKDLDAIYPQLYQGLKNKVYAAMTDHVTDGGKVPYKTRMGLSLFLGEPLDSTMTPKSILSAQSTFLAEGSEPQQGAALPTKKKGSVSENKQSALVATPMQARQMAAKTGG